MFQELRTKEQLGYRVQVNIVQDAGIYGISFLIQSAEYSPVYMEIKILEFIDQFYNREFKEESFNQWRKGALDRLKAGFNGMADEADKLERQMYTFCYDYGGTVEWYEKSSEI